MRIEPHFALSFGGVVTLPKILQYFTFVGLQYARSRLPPGHNHQGWTIQSRYLSTHHFRSRGLASVESRR